MLTRDESQQMRNMGRRVLGQIVDSAVQSQNLGIVRNFAKVSQVNSDGTLNLDYGSNGHPMPVENVRMTTACVDVNEGDTAVVDTYDKVPLVIGIVARG